MTGLHTAILALALTGAGAGSGAGTETGSDEPVLLDFSTRGCMPCRQMDPVIGRLIAKGYSIRKLDYDRNRDLARRYGVSRFPCFVMTVGGRETARVLGVVAPERLEEMFADARRLARPKLLPGPGDLPLHRIGSSNGEPQPIPLPARQAGAALAMETRPAEPLGQAISLREGSPGRVLPAVAYGNQSRPLTDAELIAATVRLRVHDPRGPSIGTGTIIDSREGRALILTCGHVFRDYREGGSIEVDLFGQTESRTVAGRLLSFDDKRDVGLLTIQIPAPVRTIRVAPRGYSVEVGEMVVNVGCNHGDDPTVRHNRVTNLDRYEGAPNIEVAGLPVPGRSGGGLFSADGYIIGVCNAADPEDNEGLYAALLAIHRQLDDANLSFIYEEKPSTPVTQAAMVAVEEPAMPRTMPEAAPIQHLTTETRENGAGAPVGRGVSGSLTLEEQRLVDELRRRRAEGAEIVCVIRTKNSPDARSEVFLFENASPQLVERLAVEGFARR
jgi:thiol-disulfide isomerase/thioredoxin